MALFGVILVDVNGEGDVETDEAADPAPWDSFSDDLDLNRSGAVVLGLVPRAFNAAVLAVEELAAVEVLTGVMGVAAADKDVEEEEGKKLDIPYTL